MGATMSVTTAIVVGNPKAKSRTFYAARTVVEQLTGRPPDVVFDLVDFGAKLLEWSNADVTQAVADIESASLVVVASPTYKGTYTGLLKLFLDRFNAGSLHDVTAIALMLGGDWRHSLAPEVFLKPVLAELGASTPTRGLFLLDSDAGTNLESAFMESSILQDWLVVARAQLSVLENGVE
jgi:FMN reductase